MVINPHGMESKVLLVCHHVELASSLTMLTGLLQYFILLHILQKIVLINCLKVHFLRSIFCMLCVAKVGLVPKL